MAQKDVIAKSALKVFAARLGVLVEVVGLPILGWLYGAHALGLYFTLWAVLRVTTRFTEFAMPTALQKFVPQSPDEARAASVIQCALIIAATLGIVLSAGFTYFAPVLAGYVHAAPEDADRLVAIIRVYAWVLPFWTCIEVLTASVRAQRDFGPEIKVRIFYEQCLRIATAVAFYYLNLQTMGLFAAHLVSSVIISGLMLRLSARYYRFDLVFRAPLDPTVMRPVFSYGLAVTPSYVIRDLISDLPILMLNQLLPGAQGAAAAGIYGVGRRIASVLIVVRQSFEYVIAPFAAESAAASRRDELREMYGFATRLTCAIIIPFGSLLLLLRHDLLALFAPEFAAATAVILILGAGRMLEAVTGPGAAVIEMIGHRTLPLLNSLAGVLVLVTLQLVLTPLYGAAGAAVSAAAGINVISILSLIEVYVLFGFQPYQKDLIKLLSIAVPCTGVTAGLSILAERGDTSVWPLVVAFVGIVFSLAMAVRHGLTASDAAALGGLGRLLRKS